MRITIVEESASRLELRLRSNALLYGAFGVLFVGLGLWCIQLLAAETRIEVATQRFSYQRTCLWLIDCGRAGAAAADVREVASVDHDVVVRLPSGTQRLELTQSDGDEKADIARRLQVALADPAGSFLHVEGSPLAGFLLGAVCVVCGAALLLVIQSVRVVADRRVGTLRLRRRLALWPPAREHEIALREIALVAVKPWTVTTDQHSVVSYAVQLETMRGERLGLTLLPMFTEAAATDLAHRLSAWLRPERTD